MIIRVFTFYVVYYGVFILNHGCPLSKWGDGVVHRPEGVDHCPRRVVHCPRGVVHYPERRVVMVSPSIIFALVRLTRRNIRNVKSYNYEDK